MDIADLKLIHILAEKGSINEAARFLYKSQSSVSKDLKKVEIKYNTKFFNRTRRGVEITREGQIILELSKHIINEIDKLSITLRALINKNYKYRVGVLDNLFSRASFMNFLNKNKLNDKVFVQYNNFKNLVEKANMGDYDFIFFSLGNDNLSVLDNYKQLKTLELKKVYSLNKKLIVGQHSVLKDKQIIFEDDLDCMLEVSFFNEVTSDRNKMILVDDLEICCNILNNVNETYAWSLNTIKTPSHYNILKIEVDSSLSIEHIFVASKSTDMVSKYF